MSKIISQCKILPGKVLKDDKLLFEYEDNDLSISDFLSMVYEWIGIDYRKFFKMDILSKLGFLASELLLQDFERELPKKDMGIILFNRSSSLETDLRYQKTISDSDNFFPSPSEFVYTLPNIVIGEIAIRNKIYGETAFYITPDFKPDMLLNAVEAAMYQGNMKNVLVGWVEVDPFGLNFESNIMLYEKSAP